MGGILALALPTTWLRSAQEMAKPLPDFRKLAAQATPQADGLAAVTEVLYTQRGEEGADGKSRRN
jgi:hypothetical protein